MFKPAKTAAVLFLLPALLLGACNQLIPVGQDTPTAAQPIKAQLTLNLFIPTGLKSQYISSATSSLRVRVGRFDTTLPLSTATCTAASGGQACTFVVNVAPGPGQALTIDLYDGSSRLLSTVSGSIDILAGQANVFNLTLTSRRVRAAACCSTWVVCTPSAPRSRTRPGRRSSTPAGPPRR